MLESLTGRSSSLAFTAGHIPDTRPVLMPTIFFSILCAFWSSSMMFRSIGRYFRASNTVAFEESFFCACLLGAMKSSLRLRFRRRNCFLTLLFYVKESNFPWAREFRTQHIVAVSISNAWEHVCRFSMSLVSNGRGIFNHLLIMIIYLTIQ